MQEHTLLISHALPIQDERTEDLYWRDGAAKE